MASVSFQPIARTIRLKPNKGDYMSTKRWSVTIFLLSNLIFFAPIIRPTSDHLKAAAPPEPMTISNVDQIKPLQSVSLNNFPVNASDPITAITFDAALTRAAVVVDETTVQVWDTATGKTIAMLKYHPPQDTNLDGSVALSPNGQQVAVGLLTYEGYQVMVRTITGNDPVTILTEPAPPLTVGEIPYVVENLRFTPDGRSLVSANRLHDAVHITRWDIQPATISVLATSTDEPTSISHNNQLALVYDNYSSGDIVPTLQIFDLKTNALVKNFQTLTDEDGFLVYDLVLNTDASRLAQAGESNIRIWSLDTQQSITLDSNPTVGNLGLAMLFGADGQLFITTDDDKLHFWDSTTGKSLRILDNPPMSTLALNPDGTLLASFDPNKNSVQFWGIA